MADVGIADHAVNAPMREAAGEGSADSGFENTAEGASSSLTGSQKGQDTAHEAATVHPLLTARKPEDSAVQVQLCCIY